MRHRVLPALAAALALAGGGLAYWLSGRAADPSPAPAAGPPWFADVTDEVGLGFVHDPGTVDDRYFMPQIVGSGCALFDSDGVGLLNAYFVNNGGPAGRPNSLY